MKAIRIGICVLVAFAILAHGGVEAWSEAVLEVGTACLLFIWAARVLVDPTLKMEWNPLLWPLFGFWVVGAMQLLTRVTVYPFLTRIELLKYSALLSLFFLCVQSFRTREQWRAFMWFLLAIGFSVSLFAIVQHFTFNGKLYWVRELRYGGIPFGPYVNRNHFAGLMELLIPTGLGLLIFDAEPDDRLPAIALFTLVPVGAVFLAASRGGIVSFLAEVAALAMLSILRRGQIKGLGRVALVLIFGVAVVSWLGVGRALDRFGSYKASEVTGSRRVAMLHGSWKIFLEYPVAGSGLGTLQEVYPRYETLYDRLVVNHSHNDYVETLAETGALGGLCAFSFLILLFQITWKRLTADRNSVNWAYRGGALIACFGLLVHSSVDFNFHIPSNALLFMLQAALATSPSLFRANDR